MRDLYLFLAIIIIPLIAEIFVKVTFKSNLKKKNSKKLSGGEVARMILDKHDLQKVYVVQTGGYLSDHYDPRRKVVRLSEEVFTGTSISALAVAAHECGHALQDKDGYSYMRFRSMIFPVVNIATSISYYIILAGLLFELLDLIYVGIAFTCLGLLFQIVTLPVEFNASSRAKKEIEEMAIADDTDASGVKNVLLAAAMTYVAGVFASAIQILRLILIARDRD